MKTTTYFKKELRAGRLLSIVNFIIALIAIIPTIMCFLFTLGSFFSYSTLDQKLGFIFSCLLLLLFYRYLFFDPFSNSKKNVNNLTRRNYWFQVFIVNILSLSIFIYLFGVEFFTYPFEKKATKEGLLFWGFMFLPITPLLISIVGLVCNIKQDNHPDESKVA